MNKDMEMMLRGYGLTTAQIFYRMPDHPLVLQTYVWQDYDLAPDFPKCTVSSNSGRKSSTDRCTPSAMCTGR